MKRLLGKDECRGLTVERIVTRDNLLAIHLTGESAIVFKATEDCNGDLELKRCNDYDVGYLEVDALDLKTQAEKQQEAGAEREARRLKFLQLKAEFEPEVAG